MQCAILHKTFFWKKTCLYQNYSTSVTVFFDNNVIYCPFTICQRLHACPLCSILLGFISKKASNIINLLCSTVQFSAYQITKIVLVMKTHVRFSKWKKTTKILLFVYRVEATNACAHIVKQLSFIRLLWMSKKRLLYVQKKYTNCYLLYTTGLNEQGI